MGTEHSFMKASFFRLGIFLLLLALPWQTRWIFGETWVEGIASEFGRLSLYGFDILVFILVVWELFRRLGLAVKKEGWRGVLRIHGLLVFWICLVALGSLALWARDALGLLGFGRLFLAAALGYGMATETARWRHLIGAGLGLATLKRN